MSSDLGQFLGGDDPSDNRFNHNEPPRARLQNEDEFLMMNSSPTPPSQSIPSSELMQSVEHSNHQLSSPTPESDEPMSQSPFSATSTIKHESSDDLYRADSPALATREINTTNGNNDDAEQDSSPGLGTSPGLQSPIPSMDGNAVNENTMHQSPRSSTKDTDNDLAREQVTLNLDSDDDIMIITPDRASPEAQRKWSQQQTQVRKARPAGDVVFVKEETNEGDGIPAAPPVAKKLVEKPKKDFEKIMAAQKALLKNMQSGGSGNGNNRSIFRSRTPNPYQNQAESSKTNGANPDHRYESPRVTGNFLRDDITQVDAAMRDGDEDHSWMNDKSEVDEEYENLKALHTTLTKKQKSGNITPDEMMELYKVEKTLQMKKRLRAAALQRAAAAEEEEECLFVPETREDVVNRHRRNRPRRTSAASDEDDDMNSNFGSERNGGGEEDDEATFHKMLQQELNGDGLDGPGELELTKSGKPRKKRAKAPKNAREFLEREEARRQQERSKAQKKKARGNANASSSKRKGAAAGASKGKGKATKKTSKAGKKRGTVKNGESLLRSGQYRRYDGMDEVGQMMLEDMMSNDPISDRLQNPIFNVEPEAPMPGQHRKETQFQKLFANIPNGDGSKDNAKSVNNDKKMLKEASRSFGYAQVKAQDGKWMIKGMRSTLYHHQLLGAQWMVQRELSSQSPHGGLLADSMG
jgi:hypothetical protein